VRGYPYKRSHLVALRTTKILASDPPSTWRPGERRTGEISNAKILTEVASVIEPSHRSKHGRADRSRQNPTA
jgi:hypothetical protein